MAIESTNVIVIKIGGSTLGTEDTSVSDIARIAQEGAQVIVIHGGGPEISRWMDSLGIPSNFVRGLRVTDAAGLAVATAVLSGLVSKRLVSSMRASGIQAVGISGIDGGILTGYRGDPQLGFVADDLDVNTELLRTLLGSGYIPVVSPLALDANQPSQILNVNADTAAGSIAAAMGASHLLYLTDVKGVLDSRKRVIDRIGFQEVRSLVASGVVDGGMIPKLESCAIACAHGVISHIIDGTQPRAIIDCLDNNDIGTTVS